ncbi:hypothetical protein DYB32_002600 [Aphanomyces invadans]|nr:hypothetical protein DYB32_002600 [Aphanomyces invadans]
MTTMPTPKQSPSGSMLLLPPEYGTWGSSSPPPASLPPDAMLAAESTGDHPSTLQSLPFPASAIVAMVAGILAVLVTAGVVAYYRHRYRQMSLQYLRNMQSTAWTFDDTTVDNDSHAPSGPPRSPSMSIWTNPNRPASEFSSGFKSQWQRHAVPSPRSMTDYQSRRARLPSLQTEVNHDALRHNGWHHAASNVSGASKPPVVSSGHAMPGSIESLSRLEPAQRMHLNRQGHNLVYDTHHASYTSAYDHECNSAISCKSSGEESTPRPKRSTRGETKLSMSSWDEP